MQASIVTSVRASILRASIKWHKLRYFHRESKVGGHTVRSVPVRGDATPEAPAALVNTVVTNEELQQAMKSLNISELTEIQVWLLLVATAGSMLVLNFKARPIPPRWLLQELAYPMILSKKDVMVASHTGSGKTLAYLLPIAQVCRHVSVWHCPTPSWQAHALS